MYDLPFACDRYHYMKSGSFVYLGSSYGIFKNQASFVKSALCG